MKKMLKTIGIIAVITIIGLFMTTCAEESHACTFGNWTKISDATCVAKEKQERSCSCGEKQTQEVGETNPDAHTLITSGEVTKAATCTEDGIGKLDCTLCNYSEPSGVIQKLGHSFIAWGETRAATCTVENQETRTCTLDCGLEGNTETRSTVAALGHAFAFNWIVTQTTYPATSSQACTRCDASGTSRDTQIGDTGPAGGKIIYISSTGFTITSTTAVFTTYTAYYLEAALTNAVGGTGVQTTMRWSTRTSSPYPDVTGTLLTIGSGRNNTALIIAAEQADYPSDTYIYAALACKNYTSIGFESFNDWFLPSRDELEQLFLRRADFGLSSGSFWSSSQEGIFAWYRDFARVSQLYSGKHNVSNVRPIRAF